MRQKFLNHLPAFKSTWEIPSKLMEEGMGKERREKMSSLCQQKEGNKEIDTASLFPLWVGKKGLARKTGPGQGEKGQECWRKNRKECSLPAPAIQFISQRLHLCFRQEPKPGGSKEICLSPQSLLRLCEQVKGVVQRSYRLNKVSLNEFRHF